MKSCTGKHQTLSDVSRSLAMVKSGDSIVSTLEGAYVFFSSFNLISCFVRDVFVNGSAAAKKRRCVIRSVAGFRWVHSPVWVWGKTKKNWFYAENGCMLYWVFVTVKQLYVIWKRSTRNLKESIFLKNSWKCLFSVQLFHIMDLYLYAS